MLLLLFCFGLAFYCGVHATQESLFLQEETASRSSNQQQRQQQQRRLFRQFERDSENEDWHEVTTERRTEFLRGSSTDKDDDNDSSSSTSAGGTNDDSNDDGSDKNAASDRIVGGQAVSQGRYPWAAQMVRHEGFPPSTATGGDEEVNVADLRPVCGGTVIAATWAITAAHCVTHRHSRLVRMESWGFHVGYFCASSNNCGQASHYVKAKRWVLHPEYDPDRSWLYDFALAELEESVLDLLGGNPLTSFAIPDDGSLSQELQKEEEVQRSGGRNGMPLVAIGSGWTDDGGSVPTQLQEIQMQYVATSSCESQWGWPTGSFQNEVVCAERKTTVVASPPAVRPQPSLNATKTPPPVNGGAPVVPPQYGVDAVVREVFSGGVCFGDSGGPVIIPQVPIGGGGDDVDASLGPRADVLVGVPSGISESCERKIHPDISSRISTAFEWIRSFVCRTPEPHLRPFWCRGGGISGANAAILSWNNYHLYWLTCGEGGKRQFTKNTLRKARRKRCTWLRTAKEKVRNKYCSSLQSDAYVMCPVTCRTCPIHY